MNRGLLSLAAGLTLGFASLSANAGQGTTLVVQMFGEGTQIGTLEEVALAEGVDLSGQNLGFALSEFACHQMSLIDPATKLELGQGIDCLANITPDDNGGISLTAVSIFKLPGGTIMSTGQTSLTAFIDGAGAGDGARTHMSGSIPTVDNIIATTGQFAGMTGRARLSGTMVVGEPLFFDCIFIVDLKSA